MKVSFLLRPSLFAKPVISLFVLAMALGSVRAQDLEQLPKEKPFEIHGTASASVGYYLSSAYNSTRRPYTYSINAAPVISLYGIQIPLNFTFNEGSTKVKNPFVQFGINPYWRWIKLYGGWTNMNWSPTTLSGKTFLGCGIEINPSLFRFGAMYGRFNPAVKEDTLKGLNTPQYKRRGFAFKIGVGNEKNYFDFIFLKAKDVSNSIPVVSDVLNFPPQENAVFGIMSYQSFLKQKLTWQLDGSVSGITRNTNSPLLDIGTGFGSKFLKVVIPPRLSTSYAWTAHTNFTYKGPKMMLGFDYNRVQPEYISMGVDYILNDQERVALVQSFILDSGKVNLQFSEGFQRDDLNKRKAVKTNRINFGANVNWMASQKFGVTFSYNNFTMFQQKGLKELNDTTKLFMIQNSVVITPHYLIITKTGVHNIFLALMYQRMDDLNNFTGKYTRNNTVNANIGYSVSVNKIGLTLSPGFNVLYSQTSLVKLLSLTPTIAVNKSWWKGKISTGFNLAFSASRNNGLWNSKTLNNTITIGYRVNNHHALRLSNSITKSFALFGGTSEYKGDLTYTFTF